MLPTKPRRLIHPDSFVCENTVLCLDAPKYSLTRPTSNHSTSSSSSRPNIPTAMVVEYTSGNSPSVLKENPSPAVAVFAKQNQTVKNLIYIEKTT